MFQQIISFAGAGKVAGALCREMYRSGIRIDLIVSESEKNGQLLAGDCKALWSGKLLFPDSTNIIIVAVPDHKLISVLGTLKCSQDTLVVHTAGSLGMDVFPSHIKRKGVFYPLQTFSVNRKIIFRELPFFLESSDKRSSEILANIAELVGGKVYFADTERRRMLHLAAVFACNFSNHMLRVANELALKAGFTSEVLEPLIKETFLKAIDIGPENSQTGPAVRNDQNTIKKHLELLSFSPELQKIYSDMTQSIVEYYKNKS
jgi:predicted short-subunit dehydrogenase-like oxidoreductase (DUF2520 family)